MADRLQIYNKALRISNGADLPDLIRDFEGHQHYLEQRARWIGRLTSELPDPIPAEKWVVKGVEEFADAECFHIFRNVMLAYYTLEDFRQDINDAAATHAMARSDEYPLERRLSLSRGYLLEEIAISLRIHVIDGIKDEFYLGEQATPVLRLYAGEYGVQPYDLAQTPFDGAEHRFYRHFSEDPDWPWQRA